MLILIFYAGGIAGSNKELSVGADNVTVHNRLNVDTLNIPTSAPGSPTDGDIYFDKNCTQTKSLRWWRKLSAMGPVVINNLLHHVWFSW